MRPVLRTSARLLALSLVTLTLLPATSAHAVVPRITVSFSSAIERYAPYQGQSTCQPVAQPGVVAFRDLILRTYPGTRNLGIVRACSVGGRSEHKEGRAWDWGVRVNVPTEKARADELIRWMLATDRYGNRHAIARRLGIMYVIWNRQIWSAGSPGAWRAYTGSSPHTDHVHFSFSWTGARRQTSFWTGKPLPGTNPAPTPPPPSTTGPLPPPRAPGATVRPSGPALVDETIYLDAARRTAMTRAHLTAGRTYHMEVSGTWSWGRGQADAECSTGPGAPVWERQRSVDPRYPRADHLDLYLNGADLGGTPVTDTGDRCDAAEHRYRYVVKPTRTLNAYLAVWDPSRAADNRGRLTVRIWADRALADETVGVHSNMPGGGVTRGSVVAGQKYAVTASGVIGWGRGSADAECSTASGDATWRRDRSVDPDEPKADHLDLLVNGSDLYAAAATGTPGGCDTAGHTYRAVWTPSRSGPVALAVYDADHSDNRGDIRVRITKVAPLAEPETVAVNAAAPLGTLTKGALLRGRQYTVEVTGAYAFTAGLADAECSATGTDPAWRRDRTVSGRSLELLADGSNRSWAPVTRFATDCDAAGNRYRWTFTAERDMQLALRADAPAGAAGAFSAVVTPGAIAPRPWPESTLELPESARLVETVELDVRRVSTRTSATLTSGADYLVVAEGGHDHGHGEADAACATSAGSPDWARDGGDHDLVAGTSAGWIPDTDDGHGCSASHTYTQPVSGDGRRLPLAVRGLDPATDPRGRYTIRIYRV